MPRYVSYLFRGLPGAGELRGDEVLPLDGISELGIDSPSLRLSSALGLPAIPLSDVVLRPVVPNPRRVLCVGLNYHDHINETKRDLPTYPVLFPKYASSLIGPTDDIQAPPETSQLDYEAELAVVIGRSGRRIPAEEADNYVLGYTVANDVTVRDFQYKTHQWMQGKAWDNTTPIGPSLVTPDEADLPALGIRTILNGVTVQDDTLDKLIFSIPTLISTISTFTTLDAGDIILTGTPGGVGFRRDPQLFMRPGDMVRVEIDGLGAVENRVVAEAV